MNRSFVFVSTMLAGLILTLQGCVSHVHLDEHKSFQLQDPAVLPMEVSEPVFDLRTSGLRDNMDRHIQTGSRIASARMGPWSRKQRTESEPLRLSLNTTLEERDLNLLTNTLYPLTLGLVPAIGDWRHRHLIRLERGDQILYENAVHTNTRQYISGLLPLAPLLGQPSDQVMASIMNYAMDHHQRAYAGYVDGELRDYEQRVAEAPGEAIREWLQQRPDALFRHRAFDRLVALTPRDPGQAVSWHLENLAGFSEYRAWLSADWLIWFMGPEGNQPAQLYQAALQGAPETSLVSRVRSDEGAYPRFEPAHLRTFRDTGLPPPVVSAIEQSMGPANTAAAAQGVDTLLIADNSGQFMNPWTRDDVLAEWVNLAIDARIGQSVGGAVGATVGAEAGRRVLANVPGGQFLGGMVGAQAGQAAGRSAAIEAVGGMDVIRDSSDLSFASLHDMARYLSAAYSDNPNFEDAINAAEQIYPGLKRSMAVIQ